MRWVAFALGMAALAMVIWGIIVPWAHGRFDRFFKWVRAHVPGRKKAPPNPLVEWHLARRALREAALNEWAVEYANLRRLHDPEPERFHQVQRQAERSWADHVEGELDHIVLQTMAGDTIHVEDWSGNTLRSYGAWQNGHTRAYAKGENYSYHEKDVVTFQPDGGVIVTCWCRDGHPSMVTNKRSIRRGGFNTMKGWD